MKLLTGEITHFNILDPYWDSFEIEQFGSLIEDGADSKLVCFEWELPDGGTLQQYGVDYNLFFKMDGLVSMPIVIKDKDGNVIVRSSSDKINEDEELKRLVPKAIIEGVERQADNF